jgi:hypothetical protein
LNRAPDRDLPGRLDLAQPVADQDNVERRGADHLMNEANAASRPCIPRLGQNPHVDQGYRPRFTPAANRLGLVLGWPRPSPPRTTAATVTDAPGWPLERNQRYVSPGTHRSSTPLTTQSGAALQE